MNKNHINIPSILKIEKGVTAKIGTYLKDAELTEITILFGNGLISMFGMLTGTISSGVLLLREIDPDLATPAANNLITGSSFGIILGAPVLVLVGLAPKSDLLCWVTLALAAVYGALLVLLICKAGRKRKDP